MRVRVLLLAEKTQETFDSFKKRSLSVPILAFPYVEEPLIGYTDASLRAMGAEMAQVQDGKELALWYASEGFSESQTSYSAKNENF